MHATNRGCSFCTRKSDVEIEMGFGFSRIFIYAPLGVETVATTAYDKKIIHLKYEKGMVQKSAKPFAPPPS